MTYLACGIFLRSHPFEMVSFSSKSVLIFGSKSHRFLGTLGIGNFTGLGGVCKLDLDIWEFPY